MTKKEAFKPTEGRAKLKSKLFNSYGEATLLGLNDIQSSWAGLKTNPWLPCKFYKTYTTVTINQREFKINPNEWECEGGEATMYKLNSHYRSAKMKEVDDES